ncbi:NBPF family member NBPF1-like [Castor canadensis]|uniref:NBPF family member NBPF1-like n=1 Tax=Castor canadensis TaxID=51338 RepID=A0AC58KJQ5_CASCN
MYVAPSSCHDLCDFHQTPDTPASTPEEQLVSRILDADENKIGLNAGEGQDAKVSRELNGDASLSTVHQDSLHEQIVTPSSCYDLSEFHHPPNTPAFLSEEYMVCTPPAVSENKIGCKGGEEQEIKAPRKDDGLIQVQVGEVSELLQQLQEKTEASFSLSQHLKVLHTQENPDNQQDQGEQLAEACRVVESFVYMISAENHDDDDENSLNFR